MGNGYGISSLTLFVSDLDSAQIHFTDVLGFSAPSPEMTEDGLIEGTVMTTFPFADMSSIELLSLGDSVIVGGKDSLLLDYLDRFEGIGMYTLSSSSVDSTHSWLTTSGFTMDSLRTYEYVFPFPPPSDWYDDRMQILKTSFETIRLPSHLPEFMEFSNFPYESMREWKSFYYMSRGYSEHPNGVVGIAAIKVVVDDLDAARDEYRKMGLVEIAENPSDYMVRFKIKRNQELHVATPQSSDDDLAGFLQQHGPGVYAIQYGRTNTAMAGYAMAQGGPLETIEVDLLLKWLSESSGLEEPVNLSREPVTGDVELGSRIYTASCATCHGENGEGTSAPALGNPMLLATASDQFLRYAIAEGRDGTPMVAYKDSLGDDEIDAVTAFLRSRASGWDVPKPAVVSVPTPDQYVLNPDGMAPEFDLRDGLYVSAAQLSAALKEGRRFVLLDARSEVAWRQTHIPGAIPVPYYKEPETFVEDLPNDDTWIVAYCACPHAASGQVISTLRKYGFKNTAILDEGVLIWTQMGYPVQSGE